MRSKERDRHESRNARRVVGNSGCSQGVLAVSCAAPSHERTLLVPSARSFSTSCRAPSSTPSKYARHSTGSRSQLPFFARTPIRVPCGVWMGSKKLFEEELTSCWTNESWTTKWASASRSIGRLEGSRCIAGTALPKVRGERSLPKRVNTSISARYSSPSSARLAEAAAVYFSLESLRTLLFGPASNLGVRH